MTPIPIGYFPKKTSKRPEWLKAETVEEICSASECSSSGPEDWIDHWLHNELWVYDTPELAWSVVPEAERGKYDLYAYAMFPVKFDKGQQHPFAIPPMAVTPLPDSFEPLGFDAVSRSYDNAFEHSPLSCNHQAEQVETNRYCLVDDHETAFRLAAEFEAGGGEPGPYYVVQVWRQRRER